MMKLIEKNIEWLVAISVVMITTIPFFNSLMTHLDFRIVRALLKYFNILILFILFLYQKRTYGIRILDKAFFSFFFLYNCYILVYLTILRRFQLDEMLGVPTSLFDIITNIVTTICYLLCAKTIVSHFNVKKYFILSLIICTIPTFIFMQTVSVDAIQDGIGRDDDNYINKLTITYSNMPILVLAVVYFNRLFSKNLLSKIVCLCVIAAEIYILIVYGKRGPILWSFVGIILFFAIKSHSLKKYFVLGLVIYTIYMCTDPILHVIKDTFPRSGARLEAALKEGDTSHRFDVNDPKHSAFFIGLENFSRSPIWGYYFRLDTDYLYFRGAYAHNVFIEMLMTMGLLGFVPFMYLLYKAFRKSRLVFSRPHSHNQIACFVLFICIFLQLQTTGSCSFKSSFWLFFYSLCCLDKFKNRTTAASNISMSLVKVLKANRLFRKRIKNYVLEAKTT